MAVRDETMSIVKNVDGYIIERTRYSNTARRDRR